MAPTSSRFALVFYAPPSAVSACKTAVLGAGAGRWPGPGDYTEVCWSTAGTGQFRPGQSANPNIGKPGVLEETPEVRVEMVCFGEDVIHDAVKALKEAHPYEVPAYMVWRLEEF